MEINKNTSIFKLGHIYAGSLATLVARMRYSIVFENDDSGKEEKSFSASLIILLFLFHSVTFTTIVIAFKCASANH
jgi:hypothetical protein